MRRKTLHEFVQQANQIHNYKYSYSKSTYTSCHKPLIITCLIHGDFLKRPADHLSKRNPQGCPKCALLNSRTSFNNFVKQANQIHNYKYTYTKYINDRTKIPILCSKHGTFYQTPSVHLQNHGCPKCGRKSTGQKNRHTLKDFLTKAKKVHDNKYIYDKVKLDSQKKISIGCPIHGYFLQKPHTHLSGKGCSKCASTSSFGEKTIKNWLTSRNIIFIEQYRFSDCKGIKNTLPFDFYLPEHNLCIEYDGKQHFMPVKLFGGQKAFERIQINDNYKNQYCQDKNIKLIRINYKEKNNINEILLKHF